MIRLILLVVVLVVVFAVAAGVGAILTLGAGALNSGAPVLVDALLGAAEAVATTVRLLKKRI
jgi:hypothetical protein